MYVNSTEGGGHSGAGRDFSSTLCKNNLKKCDLFVLIGHDCIMFGFSLGALYHVWF